MNYGKGYIGLLVFHLQPLLNPSAHHQHLAISTLFYRHNVGRCSFELAELVPFPYSCDRSTCYSNRLHDFSVIIPRAFKNFCVNSFFPCTARIFLSVEAFPLTSDPNGFKSKVNNYLFSLGSFFQSNLPISFLFFSLSFSCKFMSCSGSSALLGLNPNKKVQLLRYNLNIPLKSRK